MMCHAEKVRFQLDEFDTDLCGFWIKALEQAVIFFPIRWNDVETPNENAVCYLVIWIQLSFRKVAPDRKKRVHTA